MDDRKQPIREASIIGPGDGDWLEWVSATDTRNYLLQDPLLDWLNLYGHDKGFQKDDSRPAYDARTDFAGFILRKGREFEIAVVKYLGTVTAILEFANSSSHARDLKVVNETLEAMRRGVTVIYQGVLWNNENRTYGIPDLLVRSDELVRLFPGILPPEEARQPASNFDGKPWHYRIVSIKFTTLHLLTGGELGNSGAAPAYKSEVFIYNAALGRTQGYLPPVSYVLGRGWEQTVKNVTSRGESCIARLAPVTQNSTLAKGVCLEDKVQEACAWIRRVRREGSAWTVLPDPSVPELRPNMKNDQDAPWSVAKKNIAKELQELTLLWQVGHDKRRNANSVGVFRWRDPRTTASAIGVTGTKQGPVLQAILDINQSTTGPTVAPPQVASGGDAWRTETQLVFYVDFEAVNDLNDDFSKIPRRGGQTLIFMIGCGHIEDSRWQFKCFTVDSLTPLAEGAIIVSWLEHMKEVRNRVCQTEGDPMIIHWSPAETSFLETAYNAARQRHAERARDWPTLRWFDLLKEVIKEQPIAVRGALSFGLKVVAQALHGHHLIETQWKNGSVDGQGAMIGAWWCADEAAKKKVRLADIDLMQEIQQYNETDCKVMMEIVRYLRLNH
jgi:hypothetical protein